MNWYKCSNIKSLPSMRPRELVKFLRSQGFMFDHQSGSHQIFKHTDRRRAIVPDHPGDINKSILFNIIKNMLGIPIPQFQQALAFG